jgi:hypothetical protein
MELDFEALSVQIGIWREKIEEEVLPRDYKLPTNDVDVDN